MCIQVSPHSCLHQCPELALSTTFKVYFMVPPCSLVALQVYSIETGSEGITALAFHPYHPLLITADGRGFLRVSNYNDSTCINSFHVATGERDRYQSVDTCAKGSHGRHIGSLLVAPLYSSQGCIQTERTLRTVVKLLRAIHRTAHAHAASLSRDCKICTRCHDHFSAYPCQNRIQSTKSQST